MLVCVIFDLVLSFRIFCKCTKKNQNKMQEICENPHNMTALSLFSGYMTIFLLVLTVPPTLVIIYALIKNTDGKFNGIFYKLILNIAVADLTTGFVVNGAAINFDFREAYGVVSQTDLHVLHILMFILDAVALMTMTFLSVDRLVALLKPYAYRTGLSNKAENIIVFFTWPLGTLIVVPYFSLGYIKELLLFTVANVFIATSSLLVTTIVYRLKFKDLKSKSLKKTSGDGSKETEISESKSSDANGDWKSGWQSSVDHLECVGSADVRYHATDASDRVSGFDHHSVVGESPCQWSGNRPRPVTFNMDTIKPNLRKPRSLVQKRVTRAFKSMLMVFIICYVPTCIMMIYLNTCVECDCILVDVMRDLSILVILSASTFRAFNFIWTLKHLRRSVRQMFTCHRFKEYKSGSG